MGYIIDISHHQPSSAIDWARAAKEVDLMIIRVQYGSKTIDREYKNHVANCKKYGIPFGHYAYGHYVSVKDAIIEANDFLSRIDKDAKFLALDVEDDTVASCGTANLREASQAFIDTCRKAGYKTGYYVSHNLYMSYGLNKVDSDFLWIPRYGRNDGTANKKPDFPCCIWQYTEYGKVSWYNGTLDMNLLNGDKSLTWFTGGVKKVVKTESAVKPVTVSAPKKESKPSGTYTVQKGDVLSKIASKFGVSVSTLQSINGIKDPNKIYVGQVLKLSGSSKSVSSTKTSSSSTTYKVKAGDNLTAIAKKFGSTVNAIASANGIKDPNKISVGQTLKIPTSGSSTKSSVQYYTVKAGDNVSAIAKKFGSSIDQIKSWNKLADVNKIYVGQKLRVK